MLDQLPAKLRGFAELPGTYCVVVPVDADNDNCLELKSKLVNLYESIDPRPSYVLFRIADEETESWLLPLLVQSNKHMQKLT